MDLFSILGNLWWWGCDGRTKTADAADTYVTPVLVIVAISCLVALFLVAK